MFSRTSTSRSTSACSGELDALRQKLAEADAVLIGAGAGLSAAAGFAYSGERFRRYFGDFAAQYHFADMYAGPFTPASTWTRRIARPSLRRARPASKGTSGPFWNSCKRKNRRGLGALPAVLLCYAFVLAAAWGAVRQRYSGWVCQRCRAKRSTSPRRETPALMAAPPRPERPAGRRDKRPAPGCCAAPRAGRRRGPARGP